MVVASIELCLRIDGAFSLKDKRRVLRSLLDRARREFAVAAAEVADHDLWNSAVVVAACVGNDAADLESVLQHVVDLFDSNPEVLVESADKHIERVS